MSRLSLDCFSSVSVPACLDLDLNDWLRVSENFSGLENMFRLRRHSQFTVLMKLERTRCVCIPQVLCVVV